MTPKVVVWNQRYNLGNVKHEGRSPADWLLYELVQDGFVEYDEPFLDNNNKIMLEFQKHYLILPVYSYEHSGIVLSCNSGYPFNDRFDGGQCGWIYAQKKAVMKAYQKKKMSKKFEKEMYAFFIDYISKYSDYLLSEDDNDYNFFD